VCPFGLHLNALQDNRDREKREALKKSENETDVLHYFFLIFVVLLLPTNFSVELVFF
jgi:hypothetical protein